MNMLSQSILFEEIDSIAILRFNRPESLNALSLAAMDEFADHIEKLNHRKDLHALILCGVGEDAFCSGGDLKELAAYTREEDAEAMIARMGDALLAMENLPFPVIAAINGYALGGGSEIALACDLRIVDEAVQFGLVQIRLALSPGWGAGQRLLRLVGYQKALTLLLEGAVMNVDKLENLGLIYARSPKGQAFDTALQLARLISRRDLKTVYAMKQILQAGLNNPYQAALMQERDIFPSLWAADAHLNGVARFLNREDNHLKD